jgi:hypothetical protein
MTKTIFPAGNIALFSGLLHIVHRVIHINAAKKVNPNIHSRYTFC